LTHEEAPIKEEDVPAAQFIQLDCAIKALYLLGLLVLMSKVQQMLGLQQLV
jgi:hypothetical protein